MGSYYPPRIQWRRDACNGMYPSAKFLRDSVNAENHLTEMRHREVFSCDWRLSSLSHSFAATTTQRRWRFRTGHGAVYVRVVVYFGRAYAGGAAVTAPFIRVDLTPAGGGTTLTTGSIPTSVSTTTPNDEPSSLSTAIKTIAVSANTAYECALVTSDYGRPLGISVHEVGTPTISEATDYYNQSAPAVGGPIVDRDRERLLLGVDGMLRHNGGTLFHFGRSDAGTRTRTSATNINLVDGITTTVSAASPGYHLDLTAHNTTSRTTVPFEMAVYGMITASTGVVELVDSAGTVMIAVNVTSTSAVWTTATGSLPTAAGKYDLRFRSNGAATFTVYAASVNEWET